MKKLLPLSALALAASGAYASTNYLLEEVIVISSRVPMPLREVGTSVSVITAEEIQAQGFSALHNVLRTQAAVAVSNQGGSGATTAVRIRGEEGFRTKVYIDGIDISDTSGLQVGPRFEHLMTSGISRVEILRGPQGLMYGADAGGVINISSNANRDEFKGSISGEAGRYDTRNIVADASGGNGRFDFAVNVSDFETDGFNAQTADTELRDKDGYDNTTLHGRVGFNANDNLRLELVARDVDAEGEYDGCSDPNDYMLTIHDCENEYQQSAWRVAADLGLGDTSHQLAYTGNSSERTFIDGGVVTYATEGELDRISYLGTFKGSEHLRLVYGIDLQTESLEDGYADHERDQDGYFLEYQGQPFDNLYITTGVRYDDNEDFGHHTTYRISGAYVIAVDNGEVKVRSAYGTGFRAPSLSEIDYNLNYAPHIGLKEEESEGYDIGVTWASDNDFYLEATYFDQKVNNEIFWDFENWHYRQGGGEIKSSGIELAARIPVSDNLNLDSNYTYNDTEDSSGENRIRRPRHLFNLGVQWRIMSEAILINANLRGSYDAVDIDGKDLDNFEVLDLSATYAVTDAFALFGRIENLLDEDYEEVPGYNTSGQAAHVGARYSF